MSEATEHKSVVPDVGALAPFFKAPALQGNPSFAFHSIGGRHVLMLFFGTASHPATQEALSLVIGSRALFDDMSACFFGISCDPQDEADGRIAPQIPGIRFFLDYDKSVSTLYGAIPEEPGQYLPFWLLLDPQLRVIEKFAIAEGASAIAALQRTVAGKSDDGWAPVLEVPRIFEPELCQHLIALYDQDGGRESGFMQEIGGKTVTVNDHEHKRRSDYDITDQQLVRVIQQRIFHRLRPMIHRAFQFEATRMERYIVACYDAEPGGYFRPHRDNTTRGTAHRRFAVTINLNSEDYEGGDLRFPEFGQRAYRAPTGGAVVFSCSLLHEATPVTAGKRYAFLPFLYDDAAAAIRVENNAFLGDDVTPYSMS